MNECCYFELDCTENSMTDRGLTSWQQRSAIASMFNTQDPAKLTLVFGNPDYVAYLAPYLLQERK
jgi:hypothetical protein